MAKLALKGGRPVRTEPFPWPLVGAEEKKAVMDVVESGVWGHAMDPNCKVVGFERQFAEYFGVDYAISTTGGSTALEVALRSAGIGPGDEVITPALTWVATQLAAVVVGADPVFVDVTPDTYCIDPGKAREAINSKTRAIIPVHLGGNPCNMDAIMEVARAHDLLVIEDCAQAHGSRYKGVLTGTIGDMGCFSFEKSKLMTAGEGGMIITNDRGWGEFAYSYVNAGRGYADRTRPPEGKIRWNLRMTEFQAALLSVQLERLEDQKEKRIENAAYLGAQLSQIEGIEPLDYAPDQNYYSYVFRYDAGCFKGVSVGRFREALRAEGLPCFSSASHQLAYHPSLFYSPRANCDDFHCPVAEKARYEEAVGIAASGALLGEREDMDDMVNAVVKVKENIDELLI